ncbi:MAG: T9SS type A sorting domain-containing protein, partial [Bacteroidota bacterium]
GNLHLFYAKSHALFGTLEISPDSRDIVAERVWSVGNLDPYGSLTTTLDGSLVLTGGNQNDHSLTIGVLDPAGQTSWQRNLPNFPGHGFGSTVSDDLLVLEGDTDNGTAVLAFRLTDGSLAWGKLLPYRFPDSVLAGEYGPSVAGTDERSVFLIADDPSFVPVKKRLFYTLNLADGHLNELREYIGPNQDAFTEVLQTKSYARIAAGGSGNDRLLAEAIAQPSGIELIRLDNTNGTGCTQIPTLVRRDFTAMDFVPVYGDQEFTSQALPNLIFQRLNAEDIYGTASTEPATLTLVENCTQDPSPPVPVAEGMTVFPNPARNAVTLTMPTELANQLATVELLDLNGQQLVYEKQIVPAEGMTMRLPSVLPGVYLLRATAEGRTMTQRLLVTRE